MGAAVRELMTGAVPTVPLRESLNEAARTLGESDCGIVPVVDGVGRVTGVITDRDICLAAFTRNAPLASIPIEGVAARELISCGPDEALETVLRRMQDHHLRRLPVLDPSGRALGVLSLDHLARAGAEGLVEGAALLGALACLCAPRSRAGLSQTGSTPTGLTSARR